MRTKNTVVSETGSSIRLRKVSRITGELNEMDLPITKQRLEDWYRSNVLIQDAFPELGANQREFLITGVTQAEWDAAFGEDDAED